MSQIKFNNIAAITGDAKFSVISPTADNISFHVEFVKPLYEIPFDFNCDSWYLLASAYQLIIETLLLSESIYEWQSEYTIERTIEFVSESIYEWQSEYTIERDIHFTLESSLEWQSEYTIERTIEFVSESIYEWSSDYQLAEVSEPPTAWSIDFRNNSTLTDDLGASLTPTTGNYSVNSNGLTVTSDTQFNSTSMPNLHWVDWINTAKTQESKAYLYFWGSWLDNNGFVSNVDLLAFRLNSPNGSYFSMKRSTSNRPEICFWYWNTNTASDRHIGVWEVPANDFNNMRNGFYYELNLVNAVATLHSLDVNGNIEFAKSIQTRYYPIYNWGSQQQSHLILPLEPTNKVVTNFDNFMLRVVSATIKKIEVGFK